MHNSRRGLDLLRVIAVVLFVCGWVSSGFAQDADKTTPTVESLQQRVDQQEQTIKTLLDAVQKATVAAKPKTDPDQELRASYESTIAAAKRVLLPACRASHGRLTVEVQVTEKRIVTVRCEGIR